VNRRGSRALLGTPGDGGVERPVELEDARAVAVARQPVSIARGETRAGEGEELTRRDVEEHGAHVPELGERGHLAPGLDLPAERAQVRGERPGDPLRAAAHERPADRVAEQPEHQPEPGARRT